MYIIKTIINFFNFHQKCLKGDPYKSTFDGFIDVTIIKSETQVSHLSHLTVKKISNKFDGVIKCIVNETFEQLNEKLPKATEFPIKVEGKLCSETKIIHWHVRYACIIYLSIKLSTIITDPRDPIIYNSSGSINFKIPDESIQLYCYVDGVPPPTIQWFKVRIVFIVYPPRSNFLFFHLRMVNCCVSLKTISEYC